MKGPVYVKNLLQFLICESGFICLSFTKKKKKSPSAEKKPKKKFLKLEHKKVGRRQFKENIELLEKE